MSYNVSTFSGSKTVVIEDGTIDNSLDIFLVGKNFSGYGEIQNQNFIYLLENFAGSQPPANPLNGQLWYDTVSKKIKVYDGSELIWKSSSGPEVSNIPPTGRAVGDLWWDSLNNQLYAYTGSTYMLIGPQSLIGFGTTQFKTITLNDIDNNSHVVMAAYVNDNVMFIISDTEFILNSISQLNLGGSFLFSVIKKGITLSNTANESTPGITQGNTVIWGSASNSLKLNGYNSTDFWLKEEADLSNFSQLVSFSDNGISIGQDNEFSLFIQSNDNPVLRSNSSKLDFQTLNFGSNYFTPLKILNQNILPGENNITDIGSDALNFKNIHAQTIKIGNKSLSEIYLSDVNTYDIGTVVTVGGIAEVTQCQINDKVLGVITNDQGIILNSNVQGNNKVNVTIKGRILIKVVEQISKGDKLKANTNGTAIKAQEGDTFFAISLENNILNEVKLVEAIVL